MKYLRTNNSLEFCNVNFDNLCKECGITRHKTIPYLNLYGVAERINRNLLDKVRCMMISAGIPKSLWGEVVMIACYLINLTPFAALNDDTPHEKWHGKCVNYSILKTFGYSAFSHKNKGKLEPRAGKCVFSWIPRRNQGFRATKIFYPKSSK